MRAPEFWYRRHRGILATVLAPVAAGYGRAVLRRYRAGRPWRAPVPVICVGNLVAGGTGKTPVVLAVGERLVRRGVDVHFASRGYGGSLSGPVRVQPERHNASEVGDEPLLLAEARPTWIARDRPAALRAAVAAGAQAIVLDDGFQNPTVSKDLSLLVVDGLRGFGNGLVMPAGPLREPLAQGLARADAVVVVGPDETGMVGQVRDVPVLRAHLKPSPDTVRRLAGRKVVAFAGIGYPEKFFNTLRDIGCTIVSCHSFADHHPYRPQDMEMIGHDARARHAVPVTTAKDYVRLPADSKAGVEVVPVSIGWEDEATLDALLTPLFAGIDKAAESRAG